MLLGELGVAPFLRRLVGLGSGFRHRDWSALPGSKTPGPGELAAGKVRGHVELLGGGDARLNAAACDGAKK